MKKKGVAALLAAGVMCLSLGVAGCTGGTGGNSGEEKSEAYKMFEEAQEAGFSGSYLDFLDKYHGWFDEDGKEGEGETSPITKALASTVCIEAAFSGSSSVSGGSGVIYKLDKTTGDAIIITNYHVVYNASSNSVSDDIDVYLYGAQTESRKLKANYFCGSVNRDIALLQIKGEDTVSEASGKRHSNLWVFSNTENVEPVTFGDSEEVFVGDAIYAVGNPLGRSMSLTKGVISVKGEYTSMYALEEQNESNPSRRTFLELRVDCPLNDGNSGGGLFNTNGEYIGLVNSMEQDIYVVQGSYVVGYSIYGIGYAMPVNLVKAYVDNLLQVGNKLKQAQLGFEYAASDSTKTYDAERDKTDIEETVSVTAVTADGAASGLQVGDIITSYSIGGVSYPVTRDFHLYYLSFNARPNVPITFSVLRSGATAQVEVTYSASDFIQLT